MSLTLHTLAPKRGSRTAAFRIGRGHGSGRGKTAGRGTKGQRARAGGRNKLRLKGMKQLLLSFPKQRGFTSLRGKARAIRLEALNVFANESRIDQASLRSHGLIARGERGKIVAGGILSKKLHVSGIPMTAGAREAIAAAGGTAKHRS